MNLVFLRVSVVDSPDGAYTKTAALSELPLSSDEGAPSERHGENGKNHLLHVHVLRQAIKLACRVPRLDYQDVSALGSRDRLIKGRPG
jgi:hypothetical protein